MSKSPHEWAKVAFAFATEHLPNLLQEAGEGKEPQAFAKLAELYRERRTAQIKDRRDQIEAERAQIDAVLAGREASEGKNDPTPPTVGTDTEEKPPPKRK
jgi:hypothetical protein